MSRFLSVFVGTAIDPVSLARASAVAADGDGFAWTFGLGGFPSRPVWARMWFWACWFVCVGGWRLVDRSLDRGGLVLFFFFRWGFSIGVDLGLIGGYVSQCSRKGFWVGRVCFRSCIW
ncbi:hypothetical protein F4861DRAFT_499405 [Xylaria intraflava]|nr:hypothetical protein F4861DRAFT_499405 [Xylaria intraflava]